MVRSSFLSLFSVVFVIVLGSCSSAPKNLAYSIPENVQFFMSAGNISRDLASVPESEEFSARPGDPARRYRLKNGELTRIWNLQHQCVIAQGVQKIIPAKHPRDSNFIYMIQNGNLMALSSKEGSSSHCKEFELKTLMTEVQKTGAHYGVSAQEHPNSEVVLVALDRDQHFRAWNSERIVWERSKIESYQLNPCFALKNRNDHEVLAFLITEEGGKVMRLPAGRGPAGKIEPVVVQDAYYTDLLQYVEKAEICAL